MYNSDIFRLYNGHILLTQSGLVFAANSEDLYMRAYDVTSGRVLWRSQEQMAAKAGGGVISYKSGGRQFVVVESGGLLLMGIPEDPVVRSDHIYAFALPNA